MRTTFRSVAIMAGLIAMATGAAAITRDEVMTRARAYAYHPWRCTEANLTATCSGSYASIYHPGDYLGLPYDWGGYLTLATFDQRIAEGYGAGSRSADGVLDCTVGLDCSGFVSKCWDTGHYTTSSLHQISSEISVSDLLPGDAFNLAGSHVILFSRTFASGEPEFYEAGGYNVHIDTSGGWSKVEGFTPRRFASIEGTTAGTPVGTLDNPIVVDQLPFTDDRDTTQAVSDVLDACGASPDTNESGPEYVYAITLTQPGELTVSVQDDVGVDIDVHLYESANTLDCTDRDDATFTAAVDCGRYLIVADTFRSSAGEQAGAYTLTVEFVPGDGACGDGPAGYAPGGALGEPCGFPGDETLPFCNENLGGEICIYSTENPVSFCSRACHTSAECQVPFPGGCCADLGDGELYCLRQEFCVAPREDAGVLDRHLAVPDTARDIGSEPDLPGSSTDVLTTVTEAGAADLSGQGDGSGGSPGCPCSGLSSSSGTLLPGTFVLCAWMLRRRRKK